MCVCACVRLCVCVCTLLQGLMHTVPKFHRAILHLPEAIRDFGPYEDLTSEASESANKPLKAFFRTYVPGP
jgi:hypothetical protein